MRGHAPRPETSARRISPCVGLRWARCAARTRRCRLAATASRCRRLGRLCTSPLHLGRSRLISADLGQVSRLDWLRTLCAGYPSVKFLVTVLSAVNQHELCVLARKFGNLHIYGCWWFCNNPSIISEVTAQRLEILGTEFTAQHSDARVLDQLVYKWNHSRTVIGTVLVDKSARPRRPPPLQTAQVLTRSRSCPQVQRPDQVRLGRDQRRDPARRREALRRILRGLLRQGDRPRPLPACAPV